MALYKLSCFRNPRKKTYLNGSPGFTSARLQKETPNDFAFRMYGWFPMGPAVRPRSGCRHYNLRDESGSVIFLDAPFKRILSDMRGRGGG
jgi:hypothetical protein